MLKDVYGGANSPVQTPKGDVKLMVACGVPTISIPKGKSMLVQVSPERSKFPLKGYCFSEGTMAEILTKAAETEQRVLIRIEKQRKKNVDKEIPIDELTKDMMTAKENIVTACVGVYDFNNEKWIIENGHSDPENDPDEIKAVISAAKMGADVDVEKFFESPKQKINIPNPNNFDTQQQLLTFYFWIKGLENKYEYSLKDEIRKDFSKRILTLADEIQKLLKQADVVDHKDYAHTRARYMVFSLEDNFANLNQTAVANLNDWIKSVYEQAKDLINWTNS